MPDVIPAFVRREELERRGDQGQYMIERSLSRGAEETRSTYTGGTTGSTYSSPGGNSGVGSSGFGQS